MLHHNQRIVRCPPILLLKFKESVLELFHSFIFYQMIKIVASINTNNLKKKKQAEKPFVENLYNPPIIFKLKSSP